MRVMEREFGFFKYRFGDANVHAIAMGMLLQPNEVGVWGNLPYAHNTNDMKLYPPYHWESECMANNTSSQNGIPPNLFFTHKFNILEKREPVHFYNNVKNTINIYKNAAKDKIVRVYFLTDSDCRAVTQRVEPNLVPHFDRERRGRYKADICRIAALFEKGGYYFDIDLQAISAVQLPNHIGFVTSHEFSKNGFFQAFLAAKPHHPILKQALNKMLDHYEGHLKLHS